MYTLLHGFYKYVIQKDEYCVLILGLDNAGKTVSNFDYVQTVFFKNTMSNYTIIDDSNLTVYVFLCRLIWRLLKRNLPKSTKQ